MRELYYRFIDKESGVIIDVPTLQAKKDFYETHDENFKYSGIVFYEKSSQELIDETKRFEICKKFGYAV